MRNVAIALIVIIVLIAGVFVFTSGPESDDAMTTGVESGADSATAITPPPAVEESATDVANEAAEAAQDAADTATQAVQDAGAGVGQAVEDVQAGAEQMAEEAAEGVSAAVEGAADAVSDAQEAVGAAISDAVDGASTPEGEIADEAVEGAEMDANAAAADAGTSVSGLSDLLTVDGFDFDKVTDLIQDSSLGALQKTTLEAALGAARDNPEALAEVLAKLREALGL